MWISSGNDLWFFVFVLIRDRFVDLLDSDVILEEFQFHFFCYVRADRFLKG